MKLRNFVGAGVLFSVLLLLVLGIYSGLEDGYSITKGDQRTIGATTGNIADHLKELTVMEGIADIQAGIVGITPGGGSQLDILGNLASVAVGVLKSVMGVLIVPYEISSIIFTFYGGELAGAIAGMLAMITVYGGFLLVSAYLRDQV